MIKKEELIKEIEKEIKTNDIITKIIGFTWFLIWLIAVVVFYLRGTAKQIGLSIRPSLVNLPLSILFYPALLFIALLVVFFPPFMILYWIMEKRENKLFQELEGIQGG